MAGERGGYQEAKLQNTSAPLHVHTVKNLEKGLSC